MRDKKWAVQTVKGSSPVRGNFFAEFICSNTILASMPEWSTLGKPRLLPTACVCEKVVLWFQLILINKYTGS